MIRKIKNLFVTKDEEGQGLVEYGLILGLIAVVAIAALNTTGQNVNGLLNTVGSNLGTVS